VTATNGNSGELPTPIEFSTMVADYASACAALREGPLDHDRLMAAEAARMALIEAYERAFTQRRPSLVSV
jgi:hypothetical protein